MFDVDGECIACGGTGVCYPCNGKGATGYQDEDLCDMCDGTGRCADCNGTGFEPPPDIVPHDQFDDPPDTWVLPL